MRKQDGSKKIGEKSDEEEGWRSREQRRQGIREEARKEGRKEGRER